MGDILFFTGEVRHCSAEVEFDQRLESLDRCIAPLMKLKEMSPKQREMISKTLHRSPREIAVRAIDELGKLLRVLS